MTTNKEVCHNCGNSEEEFLLTENEQYCHSCVLNIIMNTLKLEYSIEDDMLFASSDFFEARSEIYTYIIDGRKGWHVMDTILEKIKFEENVLDHIKEELKNYPFEINVENVQFGSICKNMVITMNYKVKDGNPVIDYL